MGRGLGHSATDGQMARRHAASPVAPVVLVTGPDGQTYISAEGVDPAVRIPTVSLRWGNHALRIYPMRARVHRLLFDRAVLRRLFAGEVLPIESTAPVPGQRDWVGCLWGDGIGTGALGDKHDTRIGEARLRFELHLLADTHNLPFGPTTDAQGRRGMGLLPNRDEARTTADRLRGRSTAQRKHLVPVAKNAVEWFQHSPEERETAINRLMAAGKLTALAQKVLRALMNSDCLYGHELAEATWGEELRERADGQRGRYEELLRSNGSAVRELIAELRTFGLPICASSAKGYWLAQDFQTIRDYLSGEGERMDENEFHARRVERAAAIWYPDGPEEQEKRRAWLSQLHDPTPSEHMQARARRAAEAQRRRGEDPSSVGEKRLAEIYKASASALAEIRYKGQIGATLDESEKRLMLELKDAQWAKDHGRWPRRRKGMQWFWDPRPELKSDGGKRERRHMEQGMSSSESEDDLTPPWE